MEAATSTAPATVPLWRTILASSAGTLIEWYDFFIFGSLATILAPQFFPRDNPTAGLLFTLATFATGFIVRPFGALLFGRMGDTVGRKHTFLLTLVLMGFSTFAIGLVPGYETIGVIAPIIVVALRLLQGLAIGGEYGGAAIYVAEHSPAHRRGFYTSFIQTTGTIGLFISLLVVLGTRSALGEAAFAGYGWRIPFLLSIVLVLFSYAVRRRMAESPVFAELKARDLISRNPFRESFLDPANRRLAWIALFGATTGQTVIWYTSQLYSLYFLETVLNIEGAAATRILAVALIAATPFYIVFGRLSDRLGRKRLIVTACLLAALGLIPLYAGMVRVGMFHPVGKPTVVIKTAVNGKTQVRQSVRIETSASVDGATMTVKTQIGRKNPPKIEVAPSAKTFWLLAMLIFVQVFLATMAFAPAAAFLVELFPARIRYTSLSVPYHIGNGVFGGLVPLIGTAAVAATGNKLAGVVYPTVIAFSCFVVGGICIRERPSHDGFLDLPGP